MTGLEVLALVIGIGLAVSVWRLSRRAHDVRKYHGTKVGDWQVNDTHLHSRRGGR